MSVKDTILSLIGTGLISLGSFSNAADYEWNAIAPVKIPSPQTSNGKTILFDVSHGGTEGNADWVIDGAFSSFADALVNEGYTVEEYRGIDLNNDGLIEYFDDLNAPLNSQVNEAIITYSAIEHADVLVLAETNRPFKVSEYQALEQFVAVGKGIYFIGDHYNADRNLNTWDATEVFNGYNRSTLTKYNYGGEYGDLRNPGNSDGWLAQNFGIRFRFNALDYLAGVSDVIASVHSEGITENVQPILMAAGATLAITNPSKAKGLVYLSSQDNATAWKHANDSGLYFGGRDEGPYVAIAKAGLGKAAFIGDSSPVEDDTPKYRRQDSGADKKTYPGWTDPGDAATLSVNIINWLATPENYLEFDNSNGHTAGELTLNAKAAIEMDDPDNGNPWSTPSDGYNPWDTATFANGSFGAPQPANEVPTDPSTPTTTVSVSEALAIDNGSEVTLEGTISAELNGIYALLLTDSENANESIAIKLESSQRAQFSPQLNPEILQHVIRVSGIRNDYLSQSGVTAVSDIIDLGLANNNGDYVSVSNALDTLSGTSITVTGFVVSEINGTYGLLLQDINDASKQINVKLESEYRAEFNPQLNPNIIGAQIIVSGKRDAYLGEPGIRYVDSITKLD